jgi:hypothetical protein
MGVHGSPWSVGGVWGVWGVPEPLVTLVAQENDRECASVQVCKCASVQVWAWREKQSLREAKATLPARLELATLRLTATRSTN